MHSVTPGRGAASPKAEPMLMMRPQPAFDHALGGVLREFDEGAYVQIEVLVVRVIGRIKKWPKLTRAGVVDQDIEPPFEFAAESRSMKGVPSPTYRSIPQCLRKRT